MYPGMSPLANTVKYATLANWKRRDKSKRFVKIGRRPVERAISQVIRHETMIGSMIIGKKN